MKTYPQLQLSVGRFWSKSKNCQNWKRSKSGVKWG